jgi:hypothetical protein
MRRKNILERWGLTVAELTEIVDSNPSMRGLMLGYVAEFVLRQRFLQDPRIKEVAKDDDHDRRSKGDLRLTYRGREFRIESKSLQTNTVRRLPDGTFTARFQCDAATGGAFAFPTARHSKRHVCWWESSTSWL